MTELVLFNTLGRKLEPFQPLVPGEARVYICGPTVYNEVHIGNLRTFLFGDLLRRSTSSKRKVRRLPMWTWL